MEKQKLLLVDDIPENLQVLYRALANDYKILAATSGKDALAIADSHRPDLILLDVVMPEMDGYEVCRTLKESEILKDIPVIFLTALAEDTNELNGFSVGGVDYITKPFKVAIVRQRISIHLALKRQADLLIETNSALTGINGELRNALEQIKVLSGLLPICAVCKKIRDDKGYWHKLEAYISQHSDVMFSHGYCPECYEKELQALEKMDAT